MTSNEIIIKDSCILFDLIDLELLSLFFSLYGESYTTDYVLAEVTDEHQLSIIQAFIDSGNLVVDADGDTGTIMEIFDECLGLSLTDCSVLELASRKAGILLSSDKALRNETKRRDLTVRGVLWIIEEMVSHAVITNDQALTKLNSYARINNRAPKKDIATLIKKLQP